MHYNKTILYTMAAMGMGLGLPSYRRKPPTAVKCSLPSCDNLTTHHGGYCCAAHCEEHKHLDRIARKGK